VALALIATTASLARPAPAWATCSSTPTTATDATPGPLGPAAFVGDSTGMGMILLGDVVGQLRAAGWGPVRATAICGGRTFGADGFSALTTVSAMRRSGYEPVVWFVGLGSNDVGACEDRVAECRAGIDGLLRAIGGDRMVAWQNISHPRPTWEAAWNRALTEAAAVNPLMVLSDWVSAVNADPTLTTWDRVHASGPAAYRLRSKLLVDAGARWRQANPVTADPPVPVANGAPASFSPLEVPRRVVDTRTTPGASRLAARGVLTVDLAGIVPADATAAAVNLTVDGAAGPGFLTTWDCTGPAPTASSLNHAARVPRAAHAIVPLAGSRFCVTGLTATDVVVDVFGSYGPAGTLRFTPAAPARLLDTRTGAAAPVAARSVTEVSIPTGAGDAQAVALNVTAVDAGAAGYVAVYPCGSAVPTVSAVNVDGAAPRANLVQVAAAGRKVCLFNSTPMHLVADLAGVYGPTGLRYQAAAPARLVDTRVGTGGWLGAAGTFQSLALPAVPGAAAVALTLTVTAPSGAGYLTAHPCAAAPPTASNLNHLDGETVANAVLAGAGACVVSKVRAHVVADLTGWWVA
jgi:hypothetical protein